MILQTWKKYKKELAFKKNINAMKDWTIKYMDEVIVENHEDIGALEEIVPIWDRTTTKYSILNVFCWSL